MKTCWTKIRICIVAITEGIYCIEINNELAYLGILFRGLNHSKTREEREGDTES